MIHDFLISELTYFSIWIIIVISLNITFGYTGLVNLGHIVFFGIGAYASALLTLNGVPWYIALIAAGLIASIFGIIVSLITARLKGDYFAMVTLGCVFMAIAISRNWISLTRGALGLTGIHPILRNNFYYMLFTLAVAVLSLLFFYKLVNSKTGKIFQAIRDDETAALILGKNTYTYKILSMAISTFFAGLAGSLFAHFIQFIDPTVFDLDSFIIILSMLIAGGLASLTGSVVGTLILFIVVDSIRFVVINPLFVGPIRQMLFAVVLIVILVFRPRGIFGKVDV